MAQLSQARATLRTLRDQGVDTMKRIDEVTDGRYGADGAQKNNYGLPPKQTGGASVPLDQVVIVKTADGASPASIFADWDQEEGAAAYQVEWYSDSALTQQVGNAAVSESEHEIASLTPPGSNTGFAAANSARGAPPQPASPTSDAAKTGAATPKTGAQMRTARALPAPERVLHTAANVLSRPARVLLQSAIVVLRSNEVLVNSVTVAFFSPEGAFWHNRVLRTQQHRYSGTVEKTISWRMYDEILRDRNSGRGGVARRCDADSCGTTRDARLAG